MTDSEKVTVARALRSALGYDSREVRIHRLRHNKAIDVILLLRELEDLGLVSRTSMGESIGQFKPWVD